MSKIEEIFERNITQGYYDDYAVDCHRSEVEDALIEFGKLCFEAGRKCKYLYKHKMFIGNEFYPKYNNYEDFLKEIEDEEGN